ncbi:MAG: NUDIX domain-containing protein [Ardenticatenaceae bacterium]|nr:NUDIX domain-containing protein [Ardenticatenaceae bacterium]MCB9446682.1 NUDIX domain-containing protein [Ardenticatenaceae bacterium]
MRFRVTLVIVRDEKILLIDRQRNGRSYYVIPGGGVEPGESLAQAAIREAREELSLDVELGPLLYTRPWDDGRFQQMEFVFLVSGYTGQPALLDPEILAKQTTNNVYVLKWLPVTELNGSPCYPGPILPEVMELVNGNR